MIDHFTKEEFEAALPRSKKDDKPLWTYTGALHGEHAYRVFVVREDGFQHMAIVIRSSVRPNGHSAGVGEDSIRCWLADSRSGAPFAAKLSKYTTRVPGWQDRMAAIIRELYKIGLALKPCPVCKEMRRAFVVNKEGENTGRLFMSCPPKKRDGKGCEGSFEWLEIN